MRSQWFLNLLANHALASKFLNQSLGVNKIQGPHSQNGNQYADSVAIAYSILHKCAAIKTNHQNLECVILHCHHVYQQLFQKPMILKCPVRLNYRYHFRSQGLVKKRKIQESLTQGANLFRPEELILSQSHSF